MAWLESHTNLIRHRKLKELARALRIRRAHAMGHLHALWHVALEQQEDGDFSSWTDEAIAEDSDFPGDAPQYVRLLQTHGWFGYRDKEGNLLPGTERIVHDWLDYAGRWLIRKYSTSNRPKLVEIWQRHGRVYGVRDDSEDAATRERPPNERKATLPNQPLPTNPPTHPRGRGGGGGGRNGQGTELAHWLRLSGVRDAETVQECCRVTGLSPVAVLIEARDVTASKAKGEKIRDVGAVLAKRLTDVGYVPPTLLPPKDVCALINAGSVEQINGVAVKPKSGKFNETGVFFEGLDGATHAVPPKELKPQNIVLSRRQTP